MISSRTLNNVKRKDAGLVSGPADQLTSYFWHLLNRQLLSLSHNVTTQKSLLD